MFTLQYHGDFQIIHFGKNRGIRVGATPTNWSAADTGQFADRSALQTTKSIDGAVAKRQ